MQVQEQEADWLETARINTDDQLIWAPEVHDFALLQDKRLACSTNHVVWQPVRPQRS